MTLKSLVGTLIYLIARLYIFVVIFYSILGIEYSILLHYNIVKGSLRGEELC